MSMLSIIASMRNEYKFDLIINKRLISKVIIDQHYGEKHSDIINDELILDLLKKIDNSFYPSIVKDDDFEYFKAEPVVLDDDPYRLIFLLYLKEDILGVINCFRVPRSKV